MTGLGCGATREQAPEFALGVLSGAERAEVLLHVNGCAPCQAVVNELAEVADLIPLLAPEAEPPPGFQHRVLTATRTDRWRTLRRRALVLGATAVAAASLSIVIVRVIDAGRDTPSVAAPALRSAPMVGTGGISVGRVAVSTGTPSAMVVSVDYAVPDGAYMLQLKSGGGAASPIGGITVVNGRGEWRGEANIPRGTEARLTMVDAQGAAVCSATLPAATARA